MLKKSQVKKAIQKCIAKNVKKETTEKCVGIMGIRTSDTKMYRVIQKCIAKKGGFQRDYNFSRTPDLWTGRIYEASSQWSAG